MTLFFTLSSKMYSYLWREIPYSTETDKRLQKHFSKRKITLKYQWVFIKQCNVFRMIPRRSVSYNNGVWDPFKIKTTLLEDKELQHYKDSLPRNVVRRNIKTCPVRKNGRFGEFYLSVSSYQLGEDIVNFKGCFSFFSCSTLVRPFSNLWWLTKHKREE